MRDTTAMVVAVVLIAAIAAMSAALTRGDDEAKDARTYCEMVAIWQQDAAQGIPPDRRNGWPPYRGEAVRCE